MLPIILGGAAEKNLRHYSFTVTLTATGDLDWNTTYISH